MSKPTNAGQETSAQIDAQLRRVESLVAALLDGVDVEDLSSNQRLTLAVKMIALHTRLLTLKAQEPSADVAQILFPLREHMRALEAPTLTEVEQ